MSVRSIGCFGFKNISLINPRHPWPNKEGINASKHFSSIAKKIKVFDSIEMSIKDSDLVIATSVRKRDFHIPFIKLEDIKKKKFQKLSILFGQENNGLNNEEISHANFITTIPTLGSKSLNLSHSVSIIAYAPKHFSSIAKKIKVFDSIEMSIKDSDLVIATSVRKRDFHIPFIKLEDIKKKKFQKLSILFGQENNGLNNEEISHANFITTIPTLGSKSLNLSHSVSIIAYALTELTLKKEKILKQTQSLKSLEIETFIGFLFNELDKKNFTSVKSKRDKLQISIRNYLKTSNLSQNDLKSVYGITKFLAN